MRLICPECHSSVTVPDDAAGRETTCPSCGKSFPTPSRYAAAVSEAGAAVAGGAAAVHAPPGGVPPPIPGAVPPFPGFAPPAPPPGFVPPAAPAAEVPAVTGYTKVVGITISPKVVVWLPAALLTVVFLLTFFPWVGSYAGDSAVYSQRPWGAMVGSTPTRNFKIESLSTNSAGWINNMPRDWLLLLFLLLLLIALVFAWAERVFRSESPRSVPPLVKLWPWRNSIVAGASALALLFLLWQMANGFSMERAIKQQIAAEFADARAKAADSPADLHKVDYSEKQKFQTYHVEWTSWLYLALLCNALAVGAVMTRVALEQRGNKPPPKLLFHY